MAYSNNGLSVEIATNELPSGYTKPSVTKFDDHEYTLPKDYTIAKSGVENANKVTTFGALVTAIESAIDTEVQADYDTTVNDVTVYAELSSVRTNQTLAEAKYTNTALSYVCTVKVFVKTATA